jgi:hypothetical protein
MLGSSGVPKTLAQILTRPTSSLPHCRRRGSDRGAAALAIRQAEAEALIAGAMKLDATGRS